MTTAQAPRSDLETRIRHAIRDIPDFPKPGIMFKDITPLLSDAVLFRATTDAMAVPYERSRISHVVAIESRGFILGGPVAQRLGAGFIPVRKSGKLPAKTEVVEYTLEYGTDRLEIHADACNWAERPRVLIVDDVLATGGTADATRRLIERLGGEVLGFSFLIALSFLSGLDRLRRSAMQSLVTY
ncbi:MAG TPA: adenine phosphoribosyltransferase [Gemmatimonadaceae bacterium]|nr:adenine phosphoribosyltransferase [Gemmatimonadaceae bacterium]